MARHWHRLEQPPELPESLPTIEGGVWWAPDQPDEADELYVHVYEQGPTVTLTFYVVPSVVWPDWTDAETVEPARFVTFPEIWEAVTALALEGSVFVPNGVGGLPSIAVAGIPAPPPSPEGTAFQIRQQGALDGSPAHRRFMLAGSAGLLHVPPTRQ